MDSCSNACEFGMVLLLGSVCGVLYTTVFTTLISPLTTVNIVFNSSINNMR